MNKGIKSDGTSLVPSSYVVNSILFINHKAEAYDIQHLITDFTIKESLYSPTLIAKFSVKDTFNLIEFHGIIGQEAVEVNVTKKDKDREKQLKLRFYITEYPLYSKQSNDNLQVFTFTGVSKHAYLSKLKKISKAYNQNTLKIIKEILTNDLDVPEDKLSIDENQSMTTCKGIINYSHPINAINKLLKISADQKQSPFFLWQTLSGKIHCKSLSSIVNENTSPTYHEYIKAKDFKSAPDSDEDYLERLSKIVEITSDLKLATLFQAGEGAYASENNYLDVATKTYTTHPYNYLTDFTQADTVLPGEKTLSNSFKIKNKTISEYSSAYCNYVSTNTLAFNDDPNLNYSAQRQKSEHLLRSHAELLETQSHDIKLHGDFHLNPGVAISITLPKAIDKGALNQQGKSNTETVDEYMSGKYIITGATHFFKGGKYFTQCRIKRDSLKIS